MGSQDKVPHFSQVLRQWTRSGLRSRGAQLLDILPQFSACEYNNFQFDGKPWVCSVSNLRGGCFHHRIPRIALGRVGSLYFYSALPRPCSWGQLISIGLASRTWPTLTRLHAAHVPLSGLLPYYPYRYPLTAEGFVDQPLFCCGRKREVLAVSRVTHAVAPHVPTRIFIQAM